MQICICLRRQFDNINVLHKYILNMNTMLSINIKIYLISKRIISIRKDKAEYNFCGFYCECNGKILNSKLQFYKKTFPLKGHFCQF